MDKNPDKLPSLTPDNGGGVRSTTVKGPATIYVQEKPVLYEESAHQWIDKKPYKSSSLTPDNGEGVWSTTVKAPATIHVQEKRVRYEEYVVPNGEGKELVCNPNGDKSETWGATSKYSTHTEAIIHVPEKEVRYKENEVKQW